MASADAAVNALTTQGAPAGPVLVIGCGSIGRRHLRNLSSLGVGPLLAFDPDASCTLDPP